MRFRPVLLVWLLLFLSASGSFLSLKLTAYHYQNPRHRKNLLQHYPFLSRWISPPASPADSGTPIFGDDGASSAYSSIPSILGINCNISPMFSCQKVDESAYAEIFHIGVPVYGVIGYTWLFLLSLALLIFTSFRRFFGILNLFFSGLGFSFTLYLTFIEAFLIRAFCPLCLASAGIMTGHFILSSLIFFLQRR
ncbi:MAG: vitamin K epoxide reductase family protein [bacterium JZ-2024 1]